VARVAALKDTAFRDEKKDNAKQNGAVKIAGGVDAFAWSASGDGLVAASRSGEVTAWHCASAFFVDPDLITYTRSVTETPARGQGVVVELFDGNRATIRGGDGAVATTSVSSSSAAFFPALHAHCAEKQWDRAIRLCRFVRDDALWATLATRAMAVDELESASIAYAALEAIEKVRFVEKARAMPSVARRSAELRAFRREHEEAERILLGAGLVFRAVELNLRLLDWARLRRRRARGGGFRGAGSGEDRAGARARESASGARRDRARRREGPKPRGAQGEAERREGACGGADGVDAAVSASE
jgi:intraflagellar transport protein 80